MRIESGEDEPNSINYWTAEHLNNQPEIVQKTHSLSHAPLSHITTSSISLKEKITSTDLNYAKTESVFSQIKPQPKTSQISAASLDESDLAVDPEEQKIKEQLEEIQTIFQENPPNIEPSYLIKFQKIVGLLLEQLHRISQKSRDKVEKKKEEYSKKTQISADQTKSLGWNEFKFSILAFSASFFSLSPYLDDQAIGKALSEQLFPGLSKMFGADMQGNIRDADSVLQMIIQDLSNETNQNSSQSSMKQEASGILERLLQSLRDAARSN